MATAKTRTKTEPNARKRKADDPEQYERFREAAHELQTDNDPELFDRQLRKILRRNPSVSPKQS